jgi:iron complex outermembrane receptor protein
MPDDMVPRLLCRPWRVVAAVGFLVLASLSRAPVGQAQEAIEEVRVTTQKRAQPLQEVPVSVSVRTGEALEHVGIRDVFGVADQIPSLTVVQNTGPLNTGFRIRRIGNEPNIPNFEPAVGLFVDGAYRTRSSLGVGDLLDIERIEVVRGPQTTLYGRNTTAGVINVITKSPSDSFEATGEIAAGRIEGAETADMYQLQGVVNTPITDKLSARFGGSLFKHGPTMINLFAADDSDDMDRYSLRAQLLYEPSSRLRVRTVLGRFVIDSATAGQGEMDEGIGPAAVNAAFGVPCPPSTSTDRRFCSNRATSTTLQSKDATVDITYERDGYTLTSVSAYEAYDSLHYIDADQLNLNVVDFFGRGGSASYSQELRLASPTGRKLEWLSGIYYYRNVFNGGDPALPTFVLGPDAPLIQLPSGLPLGQPGDAGTSTSRTKTEHVSPFASVAWHATAKATLTVGARWQSEDKESRIVNTANHSRPTIITLVLAPESANAVLSRSTHGSSFSIAGQYEWSDALMAYVSVARGFKSGGFNAGANPGPGVDREFADETVLNHEIGVKSLLLDRRLRLNASVFSAVYHDFQSAGFVSLRFQVNNAERVDVSGLDADLEALVGEHYSTGLTLSYADATYGRYTGGGCYYNRLPDNADGTACVLTGSRLPFAPLRKASANFEYRRSLPVGGFYARIDWAWVDSYQTNETLDPRHVQNAYGLIDLRAGLARDRFDVSAWVKNLTNETFVMQDGPTNLFPHDPAFGRFLGAPRSYGVTVRALW